MILPAPRPNPQPIPFRKERPAVGPRCGRGRLKAVAIPEYSDAPFLKGRGWGLGLRGTDSAPGFTLLEIAVVLFLMGLMLLLVMPYMGGLTDAELKSASRRLAGRATYLYDEASSHKLVIQLVFDMNTNAYFVMIADPYSPKPAFLPDHSMSGRKVILPGSVRIRDVTVEGIGTLSRGTVATQFYPQGYVDGTVVHLIDVKGRVMTIAIDPLTGQVMVAKGDLRKPIPGAL